MISIKSSITQAVLGYLFLHEEQSLYLSEIARKLHLDKGNLSRKLSELEEAGLLQSEIRGKERFFSLNRRYAFFEEYKQIILKSVGIEAVLKKVIRKIPGVKRAFIFGSYAKKGMDAMSDIDLMVIGDHSSISLRKAIALIQKKTDRQINLLSIGSEEYQSKKKNDPFIKRVEASPKIELI